MCVITISLRYIILLRTKNTGITILGVIIVSNILIYYFSYIISLSWLLKYRNNMFTECSKLCSTVFWIAIDCRCYRTLVSKLLHLDMCGNQHRPENNIVE